MDRVVSPAGWDADAWTEQLVAEVATSPTSPPLHDDLVSIRESSGSRRDRYEAIHQRIPDRIHAAAS